eukprot:7099374-Pyramimonas_sp.AAC.1
MATSTTVDTVVAEEMLVTMLTATTTASHGADADLAKDDESALASVVEVLERVRHARAAAAREWPT